ncbi:hypothetical protein BDW68DRAFT_189435 [Aspergillus falconensis]
MPYLKSAVALSLLPELLAALTEPCLDCANFVDFGEYCVMGAVTPDEPSATFSAFTTPKKATTTTTSTATAVLSTTDQPTTTTTLGTAMATGDSPSPTQPGLAVGCDKFHKVASGDQCGTIEAKYGITNAQKYHKVQSGGGCYATDSANCITLDQFRKWNPTIDACRGNLWVDYYACVGV